MPLHDVLTVQLISLSKPVDPFNAVGTLFGVP